jgi:hypothetical protein
MSTWFTSSVRAPSVSPAHPEPPGEILPSNPQKGSRVSERSSQPKQWRDLTMKVSQCPPPPIVPTRTMTPHQVEHAARESSKKSTESSHAGTHADAVLPEPPVKKSSQATPRSESACLALPQNPLLHAITCCTGTDGPGWD